MWQILFLLYAVAFIQSGDAKLGTKNMNLFQSRYKICGTVCQTKYIIKALKNDTLFQIKSTTLEEQSL